MYAIPHQTLRMHTDGEVPRLNFSAGTNRYTRAGRDRHLVFRSLAFAVCESRMPPHVGQGMHSLCTSPMQLQHSSHKRAVRNGRHIGVSYTVRLSCKLEAEVGSQ